MLSQDVLTRAGIEQADGLAAVTNSDSVNAVVGARGAHGVQGAATWWCATTTRAGCPCTRPSACQVVSSTAWGAQRIEELLYQPLGRGRCSRPATARSRSTSWRSPSSGAGRTLGELLAGTESDGRSAFTRGGPRPCCPRPDLVLEPGDVLLVSATLAGIEALRERAAPPEGPADGGDRCHVRADRRRRPHRRPARVLPRRPAARGACCIEHRPQILAHIHRELPTEVIYEGNATDPDVLERAGIAARPGAGRLHGGRRRQPRPLLHRAQPLPRCRARSPPSTTRATPGSSTPSSTWTWPLNQADDPGQPHRAGDVAGRHDDAAQAAPRPLLAREREDPAGVARGGRRHPRPAPAAQRRDRRHHPPGRDRDPARPGARSRPATRCWPSWTKTRSRSWPRSSAIPSPSSESRGSSRTGRCDGSTWRSSRSRWSSGPSGSTCANRPPTPRPRGA